MTLTSTEPRAITPGDRLPNGCLVLAVQMVARTLDTECVVLALDAPRASFDGEYATWRAGALRPDTCYSGHYFPLTPAGFRAAVNDLNQRAGNGSVQWQPFQ